MIAELAARGRAAVAVDLAAHGLHAVAPDSATRRPFDAGAFATEPSPVAGIGLDAAADLLIGQVEAIGGGRRLPVVAHSMGGAVLTRAAEREPGLFAHLYYLAAYMPASDTPCLVYPSLPEGRSNRFMPLLVGDPERTGALRIDPGNPDPEIRTAIREAFYGDVEEAESGGRDRDAQLRRARGDGGGKHHSHRFGLGFGSPHVHPVHAGPHHSRRTADTVRQPGRCGIPRQSDRGFRAHHGAFGIPVRSRPGRGRPHPFPDTLR
ncbi:hypothetical protein AB0K15_38195 [Amycolatopsis sp. NPDC049253]|uniref:hypothetical protein n=1 Tax=Amycolatopsis sp. NPDC049253 TaxID=3155274 RepID=UPI003418516A